MEADLAAVRGAIEQLRVWTAELKPLMDLEKWSAEEQSLLIELLVKSYHGFDHARVLLQNCSVYASCLSSTDMKNEAAHKLLYQTQALTVELNQACQAQTLFMTRAPDFIFEAYIQEPTVTASRFVWEQRRKQERDLSLTEAEESLLSSLSVPGMMAWGKLYDKICGTMRVDLKVPGAKSEIIGLAQAQSLTKQGETERRRAAWDGIQEAWSVHEESAAAILNSLTGWRLEVVKRRSGVRKIDYLHEPLSRARIERRTLEAMYEAVLKNVEPMRATLRAMAGLHGKKQMDPWDLLAPSPVNSSGSRDFDSGLKCIVDSFSSVAPEFGDFVTMMRDRRWIEARVLPNKGGGAYCTRFPKSQTPRVFQTYMGSIMDVSTLAHELGHAFHGWVMRDLPNSQQAYPMTLAETASIFAETVLSDHLFESTQNREEKIDVAYAQAENAVSLLLNISARFDFEKSLNERRMLGVLSPEDLREMNDQAWTKWYGDSLSRNDKMFWASKMHFHMARLSFYNFPYTFGYLFALSIYARREEFGPDFMSRYVEILRDTGRMTAEDLIRKHLGEDIRTVEFWQKSLDVVRDKVDVFQALVSAVR